MINKTKTAQRRILVVDQNSATADIIQLALADDEFIVKHVYDEMRGLVEAKIFQPDVICVNVGLEIKPSIDFAHAIRQSIALKDVSLVALSAWSEERYIQQMDAAGFNNYATKPLNLPDLIELIISFFID